jgi:secreted trypsin-like serine protease
MRLDFYIGAVDSCGLAALVQPLIVNGNAVKRGVWPWLTAIFQITDSGLEFICGGTLISKNHVITGNFFYK